MFSNETSCPSLFADLLATRLRQDDLWQHEPAWQHYFGLNGTPDLLDVTANFLQERLAQVMIISAGDCARLRSLWSGAKANCREIADGEWGERWAWGSGLDHIGPWGCRHRTHPHICKVALLTKPLFPRFFADMNERMQTKVVGMHLEEVFVLTPQLLESEILRQRREGGNVKGFLFCNPNNPLGVVYPRQLAIDLMEVCKRHKVRCSLHYFYCRFLKTVSWLSRCTSYLTRSTLSPFLTLPPPFPVFSVSQWRRCYI